MGYLGDLRNTGLKKMGEECKYATTYKLLTAVTGIKQKSGSESIFEKTAHGLETGNIVYLKSVTGGTTTGNGALVKTGEFMYVKEVSSSEFELSQTESFVAEKIPTGEAVSAMEVQAIEETSETPLKIEGEAWAFKAAAERAILTSKEKAEVAVAEGKEVGAVAYGKKSSVQGTKKKPTELQLVEKVTTPETVGASKKYVITEIQLQFLAQ